MVANKTSAVVDWPRPRTRKELQRFLGLPNYLRTFVDSDSRLAKPLTDLTSPKCKFIWSRQKEATLQELKQALTKAPVLRHVDPTKPFFIEPDASNFAIGAGLSQSHGNKRHPVAYHSRKLLSAEQNYSIHDKELLAIIDALRTWRHLLLGSVPPVTILSDHRNLTFFRERRQLSQRHVRWSLILSEYEYVILYQPGDCNNQSDALSRRPDLENQDGDTVTLDPIISQEHFIIQEPVICQHLVTRRVRQDLRSGELAIRNV